MNKAETTHDILEQTGMGERIIGVPGSEKKLKEVVPEPEPEREVRVANALNVLYRELDVSEVSDEFIYEMNNLLSEFEDEACKKVIERIVEDTDETSFGMNTVMIDPISKVKMQYSEAGRQDRKVVEMYEQNLAKEVICSK